MNYAAMSDEILKEFDSIKNKDIYKEDIHKQYINKS